jgi:hypothetical protein
MRGIPRKPPELGSFGNYLRSKSKPTMANATPTHELIYEMDYARED